MATTDNSIRATVNPDNKMAAETAVPAAGGPTPQRTDLDLDHFRTRLLEERALAEQTIRGTRGSEDDGTGMMGMEMNELSTAGDNHPADIATELQLREQDSALIANAKDILNRIERALQKIEEGTYGICDKTHEPIPIARLEAIPYATLTVEAQSVQEIT